MDFEKHKALLKQKIVEAVGDAQPTMSEEAMNKAVESIIKDFTAFSDIINFTDEEMQKADISYYAEFSVERGYEDEPAFGSLIVDCGRWLAISGATGEVMFT